MFYLTAHDDCNSLDYLPVKTLNQEQDENVDKHMPFQPLPANFWIRVREFRVDHLYYTLI